MIKLIGIILSVLLSAGVVYGIFSGNGYNLINEFTNGAGFAIETCVSMCGMMMLWCGIMNIAKESGITKHLSELLSPIIRFIMPEIKKNSNSEEYISLNIASNALGLGNAATPIGIKAIKEMKKEGVSEDSIAVFMVINCSSVQIIPSGVAAIRTAAGSINAYSVMLHIWITSFTALLCGIIMIKIIRKIVGKRYENSKYHNNTLNMRNISFRHN